MSKRTPIRWLAMVLVVALTLGLTAPAAVSAEETQTVDLTGYETFLANLKVLEEYAEDYYAANPGDDDTFDLVLNYVRTGVEKYTSDSWTTLAGAEITGFVEYVAAQDAANGTTASDLREIYEFQTPNGQTVEFEHMFGTMNISYVNSRSADLGGWAGDLCDLLVFTKTQGVTGEIEEMVAQIRENYLLLDEEDMKGFGQLDIYGDLDGYYLTNQMRAGTKLSAAMEAYFTEELTDEDRAAYFLNNRFSGLETNEDVRAAVYDTYKADVGIKVLEADEGITSDDADLRTACCYAFADYLFELAGDRLEGEVVETTTPTEATEPTETTTPDEGGEEEEPVDDGLDSNDYYEDFSVAQSTLAPGVVQTLKYALTNDNKQIAYYIATVDVSRDDLTIYANYKDNDPSQGWGMARVEDQVAAAEARHTDPESELYIENYTPVVGVNGDFYNISTGKPSGVLVMEGVQYSEVNSKNFFAILADGSAVIGEPADWDTYADQVQEAIGGGVTLIKDGQIVVSASSDYYNDRASRTCVGITADGQVVLMVLDGRQEPFSAGGAMIEIAQIMLEAGCVSAINLDGGGSSTYLSKPEGGDEIQLVNSPSDGYARSVSTSLVVVSTAKSSKEFDHAVIDSDYDYLTIGTELQLTASGVSNTGNSAPMPEVTAWQVSDETIAQISEDGVLTALDNGDVEVQLTSDGEIIGTKTIHVVVPNGIGFETKSMSVIYDIPTEIPLYTTYNGNPVAFNVDEDVLMALTNADAGEIEGLMFTAYGAAAIRNVQIYAMLAMPEEVYEAYMDVKMYNEGESIFDFDNADGGDRNLAWNRDVTNSTKEGSALYHVTDPSQEMEVSYVFALDMESIQIPEKLKDIVHMLPGADDPDATAWSFLMQLAERVSTLTEVKVVARFDADLDVDISNLTVVNDYFYKKSAVLDEDTNTLTLICGWVDQTAAIDPDTADPICILSGMTAKPNADAQWSDSNQIVVESSGEVTYDIYLRASSLYSFAKDEANQEEYGLYPFVNPDNPDEKGAHFADTYVTFQDTFTLDNTNRQSWYSVGTAVYYYVDNVALTGVQKVPCYEDPSVDCFYQFDSDGACLGTVTGLAEVDGKLYYAIQGEMMTGWRTVVNAAGGNDYYFFNRSTGEAVDGKQKIDGYNYTFTDRILTRGEIVTDENGSHYRWAGAWVRNQWVIVDGNYYFAKNSTDGYFAAGGFVYVRDYDSDESHYHLFDDNGVWQKDYSGMYDVGEDTYLVENGVRLDEPGLVYIDGYYYYFCSTGKAIKNRTYWPTKTNGLLPSAAYDFDEYGRITNPPTTEDPEQTDPTETTEPGETEPVKNGFVKENGAIYYYVDGAIQYAAGLIQVDGDYYYVRSNGQLATGKYWITKTNDLLPEAMYEFDEETGKMLNPPSTEEPEPGETEPEETEPVKNGIVEENGTLYYYIDGTRAYGAGLLKLTDEDGDEFYIYVRSNGQLATGVYWPTTTNDLLPAKAYDFGEDGRLYLEPKEPEETEPETSEPETSEPEESEPETSEPETSEPETSEPEETEPVKNGIVEENGTLYYYIDGTRAYGAGLLKLTDEEGVDFYIYVRSNGQLATGVYWPTTTNDLLPGNRAYDFGKDGRLYL